MSKRYPPIFNVILFIVAVCIILANPMTMLMPWISTVTSFVVFAVSSIFNAVGYVYDHYTIFALHVVIIALYAKQLFGKEAKAIDDRLLCVLNEFSVLAHGHAMCNYWSYEQKEATIMIQNTMQPITLLIAYLSAATLLILARAMQEVYSDDDGASVLYTIGSTIEILIGSDVGLLILPLFITGVANIIYLLVSPLLNV